MEECPGKHGSNGEDNEPGAEGKETKKQKVETPLRPEVTDPYGAWMLVQKPKRRVGKQTWGNFTETNKKGKDEASKRKGGAMSGTRGSRFETLVESEEEDQRAELEEAPYVGTDGGLEKGDNRGRRWEKGESSKSKIRGVERQAGNYTPRTGDTTPKEGTNIQVHMGHINPAMAHVAQLSPAQKPRSSHSSMQLMQREGVINIEKAKIPTVPYQNTHQPNSTFQNTHQPNTTQTQVILDYTKPPDLATMHKDNHHPTNPLHPATPDDECAGSDNEMFEEEVGEDYISMVTETPELYQGKMPSDHTLVTKGKEDREPLF